MPCPSCRPFSQTGTLTTTTYLLLLPPSAEAMQWILSHCNVPGNEADDSLAKESTTKEQVDKSASYPEMKTILKVKQHSKWRLEHPRYRTDPLLPFNQTGTSESVQTQDRPQPPQPTVPLQYWQSDNRTSTAVLPPSASYSERESDQTTLP